MLSAHAAILRTRRAIGLGLIVRAMLWAAAIVSLLCVWVLPVPFDGRTALAVVAIIWVTLALQSWQSTRLSAGVSQLLASGEFDAAEREIDRTLRAFSMFRPVKLIALHQLAVLRMAQGRFDDAAAICRELLVHKITTRRDRAPRGGGTALSRSSNLMLAQALLEQNDAAGAALPLAILRAGAPASIAETMHLLHLDLDYGSRVGAWNVMFDNFWAKSQLAEVMPAPQSARTQAMLALAAKNVGRADAATWLRRRAELLAAPAELVRHRPILTELWPDAMIAKDSTDRTSPDGPVGGAAT